jgi:hypothetical protein
MTPFTESWVNNAAMSSRMNKLSSFRKATVMFRTYCISQQAGLEAELKGCSVSEEFAMLANAIS